MIAHLSGILLKKTTQAIIIDSSGVGYEVIVPLSTFYSLPDENEGTRLHIFTHVKEDALALFGFETTLEKDIFIMLKSVSGIGPKLAINILSGIGPDDLVQAIARGDAPQLQAIPGVGKKTAERIALELKDKAMKLCEGVDSPVPSITAGEDRGMYNDALSALLNLGYPAKSAKRAVDRACALMPDKNLEGLIKEALKILA